MLMVKDLQAYQFSHVKPVRLPVPPRPLRVVSYLQTPYSHRAESRAAKLKLWRLCTSYDSSLGSPIPDPVRPLNKKSGLTRDKTGWANKLKKAWNI